MTVKHYIDAQNKHWDNILKELTEGKKVSHWVWYVFPQIKGIVEMPSPIAQKYEFNSLEQAREYASNDTLRDRLDVCIKLMLSNKEKTLVELLPEPDNLKFISSMTLFTLVLEDSKLYEEALHVFNQGNMCEKSKEILIEMRVQEVEKERNEAQMKALMEHYGVQEQSWFEKFLDWIWSKFKK